MAVTCGRASPLGFSLHSPAEALASHREFPVWRQEVGRGGSGSAGHRGALSGLAGRLVRATRIDAADAVRYE